ncbi:hypothetical protein LCGC14_0686790 [marine sediment metagenome]|uniref:Uncharacterized protein n=1 Tax=marine sediment metagenome TaxID=412755 RepID=A0A0F9QRC2_9ZZZZ
MVGGLKMETQRLWELVCQNAEHIQVINREMGEVMAKVEYIKGILNWQFGLLSLILAGLVFNIFATKRNGRK